MKIVVQTDGAAIPNPGPAGIGAVIKDEKGKVITNISQTIGRATNNQAEYRAIIAALEEAIRLGANQVEVRTDSELVARQLKGQYRVKTASLKPLYQKLKQLQSQLEGLTVIHLSGEKNTEAHNLAHRALR